MLLLWSSHSLPPFLSHTWWAFQEQDMCGDSLMHQEKWFTWYVYVYTLTVCIGVYYRKMYECGNGPQVCPTLLPRCTNVLIAHMSPWWQVRALHIPLHVANAFSAAHGARCGCFRNYTRNWRALMHKVCLFSSQPHLSPPGHHIITFSSSTTWLDGGGGDARDNGADVFIDIVVLNI